MAPQQPDVELFFLGMTLPNDLGDDAANNLAVHQNPERPILAGVKTLNQANVVNIEVGFQGTSHRTRQSPVFVSGELCCYELHLSAVGREKLYGHTPRGHVTFPTTPPLGVTVAVVVVTVSGTDHAPKPAGGANLNAPLSNAAIAMTSFRASVAS